MVTRRALLASPFLLARSEAEVTPDLFRFRPELEPLVTLIENTPREKCAEMAAVQLKRGVSYRQFMAALFLAGIRNVNPRPPGFALHCVFIIHAAHLLGMEAPADLRLLPLFFALDDFKKAQERDAKAQAGDYTMRALTGALPAPEKAAAELRTAMEAWDQERAERAVVTLARNRSVPEVFELLWRYGVRDQRNIGHKAIYSANAIRTLQTIGEQHAEPVFRSLVLSLLDFGLERKIDGYAFEDQSYPGNAKRSRELFSRLPATWMDPRSDASTVRSLLATLRDAPLDEGCADVATRLSKGQATAGSVWDAVHLAAAELQMRIPASGRITGIHTVTSANGLRHCYLAAADAQTRFLILLQAAGWMAQFRTRVGAGKDPARNVNIAALEPASEDGNPFAVLASDQDAAAARVLRLARDLRARDAFQADAVRHIAAKANEVHYLKYLASIIEDVPLVSAEWQPHLMAASVYYLKGPDDPDSLSTKQAREVLQ